MCLIYCFFSLENETKSLSVKKFSISLTWTEFVASIFFTPIMLVLFKKVPFNFSAQVVAQ